MGRSELNALLSRYAVLCAHILKSVAQPDRRARSWDLTIAEQRIEIARLLKDNPGLKPKRSALVAQGYQDGRKLPRRRPDWRSVCFRPFRPLRSTRRTTRIGVRRNATDPGQSSSTMTDLARSFCVSLFNWPQAARISRPRGVRTGLA